MNKRSLAAAALAAVFLSCGGGAVPTGSEIWQPLFNGSDLAGWENVGDANWTVEDGSIVVRREDGQTNKGWLVTEREFTDFKLRLQFKTKHAKFNSGILIRDPGHAKVGRPAFNGFEVQLLDYQDGKAVNPSGSIYDLARAYPREINPDTWTHIEIHCIGDHISTFIDGEKTAEAHTKRSFLGAIGLQMHGGNDAAEYSWRNIELLELLPGPMQSKMLAEEMETAPGEFVDFLAGKRLEDDFDVYWNAGAEWTLRDGVLRGEGPQEIAWLFDKAEYGDYILAFDYRLSAGGNAGTCHRFRWPADGDTSKGPAFIGFECQIVDVSGELNPTGSIYSLARAYETDPWHRPMTRSEGWNQYRIYVLRGHAVTYVNRHKGAEVHMDREAAGRIGFQVHHPAKWVEYRNVMLKVVE